MALEVIPRTLAQNCGANVIRLLSAVRLAQCFHMSVVVAKCRNSRRTLTKLRAKHAETANSTFGIDGLTGQIADMKELGIWEPYEVKVQTMKTAIEAAAMLMRIDDIVSGIQRKSKDRTSQPQQPQMDDGDNVRCH